MGAKLFWRMKRLVWRSAFRILDGVTVRDDRYWVLELGKDNAVNGNLGAFLHHVARRGDVRMAVIAAEPSRVSRAHLPSDCPVYGLYSRQAALAFARAGAVFVHHARLDACGAGLGRKRSVVDLWHGIPVKGLRHTASASYSPGDDAEAGISSIIASSKVDALAMAASFHMPYHKVWVTGLPRNDLFAIPEADLPPATKESRDAVREVAGGKRFVLYAPTFRGDSRAGYGSGLYPATGAEREKLCETLRRHDAVLGLRVHGYFSPKDAERWEFTDRIVDVGSARSPDANGVLLATDILVTDYSSIWVDFLLTGRSVIGFVHDLDRYDHDRGTIYDYQEIFPGPLVVRFDDFLERLETALEKGSDSIDADRYERSRRFFFSYHDGGASARIVERVTRELELR